MTLEKQLQKIKLQSSFIEGEDTFSFEIVLKDKTIEVSGEFEIRSTRSLGSSEKERVPLTDDNISILFFYEYEEKRNDNEDDKIMDNIIDYLNGFI